MALTNLFPSLTNPNRRLAIVVECPSKDDVLNGQSFSSASGNFLRTMLSQAHIPPQECFFGYVYPKPAPRGMLEFCKDKDGIAEGLTTLVNDLERYQPNCVLLLGRKSLDLFDNGEIPRTLKGAIDLDSYRGSIFETHVNGVRFKCVSSFTPLRCFQNFSDSYLLKFDILRAAQEASTPDLNLPDRDIVIATNIGSAMNYLNELSVASGRLAFDVEGYPDACGVNCFSLAPDGSRSYVFPLRRRSGASIHSVEDEMLIWQKLNEILTNPAISIISQNAGYELFMMAYRHGILIKNVADDTMIKHWCLWQELEKNLGLQTSIYTREPYFKDGRHSDTDEGHWLYNGKDSAILHDIDDTLEELHRRNSVIISDYKLRLEMLKPYLYLSMKGCRIDLDALTKHRHRLLADIEDKQLRLNAAVGRPINVKSPKDKPWLLYEYLQFPKQYKGRGKERSVTADEEAIKKCRQSARTDRQVEILTLLLSLIKARTDFSDTYKIEPFSDARIRASYNVVGTVTGRLSSSKTSVKDVVAKAKIVATKSNPTDIKIENKPVYLGTNLQNVSEWLRDAFIPDTGHTFWQFDYSGADAWTVAADLAALGRPAMLNHLRGGIKPSCVILMMHKYGTQVLSWSHERILSHQPEMMKDTKMYVCSKGCQHGTNYGLKAQALVDLIFKKSDGQIVIPTRVGQQLQDAYETYYQVSRRTEWIEGQLKDHGQLTTATGCTRKFLGLRGWNIDHKILNEALSFEPQCNTTYATNVALSRLFYDENNRYEDGNLIHQPLLMIHDALAGQTRSEDIESHRVVLQSAFDILLTIHGQTITMPAEGHFGKNWKDCK